MAKPKKRQPSDLYEVVFRYPWKKVATQPGCVKTAWKYRRYQFTVRAKSESAAVRFVVDHMMTLPGVANHAASCTADVTMLDETPGDGIKFSAGGNGPERYKIRPGAGGYVLSAAGDE